MEHFFQATPVNYLNITNKDKLFHAERNRLLGLSGSDIAAQYVDVLNILKESIPFVDVDLLKYMRFTVIDFIQLVQKAVERGDVKNIETLRSNGNVDYKTYNQILECRDGDFTVTGDRHFSCKVYLKSALFGEEKQVEFTDRTTARDFQFE